MTAQQDFWAWFLEHEEELYYFDPENDGLREAIFNQLHIELKKIDPHLVFEFGPNEEKRVFVISADGIQSAFTAVIKLANAAPVLDRWEVVPFRPRRYPVNPIELGNIRVDPKDVEFTLLDNGKIAGLLLFIPGFQEKDVNWKVMGYLLLDESLGEFDVESRLGFIEMFSPETARPEKRYPFAELPSRFDELISRLEKRSGRPS